MQTRSLLSLALLAVGCSGSTPAAPPAAPRAAPSTVVQPEPRSLSGIWLGTLEAKKKLRIQLRLDLGASPPRCALDSLDQHALGIPCGNVVASSTSLSLDVPRVHGGLTGTVSADGNSVNATWTQDGSGMPLVLTRQATAIEPPKAVLDPAMPPVGPEQLKTVLDADLAAVIERGELAPAKRGGMTIGVVSHGVRRIFSYGDAKPDSVFEIGSVTKTFTGLALAQMAAQKKVRLDEPVRALLPAGTVEAPASGAEITLVDLSAQRSGLPRLPDNLHPADPTNPYADYHQKALYAFVASHGVARPPKPTFGYSNLGVGLLGHALAARAGSTYEALLLREVTGPLGMRDTAITLSPSMRARFVAGHDANHQPDRAWDFDALAGAGALKSTAQDMLTYLEAQLHPESLPASAHVTAERKTLTAAIKASHEPQAEAGDGMHIALNWFRVDASGSFWHNGGTGGFSAYALFDPENDLAVIVLSNTATGPDSITDALGKHIVQRLTGAPATSLAPEPSSP